MLPLVVLVSVLCFLLHENCVLLFQYTPSTTPRPPGMSTEYPSAFDNTPLRTKSTTCINVPGFGVQFEPRLFWIIIFISQGHLKDQPSAMKIVSHSPYKLIGHHSWRTSYYSVAAVYIMIYLVATETIPVYGRWTRTSFDCLPFRSLWSRNFL